ncbi:MAG: CehA/McbA family metallohydrolase, partial [Chloroflexota bacterium]
AQGGLFTIAHPVRLGSPVCTGCGWDWPVAPRSVDLWEIFSDGSPRASDPEPSLVFWQRLLMAGGRAAPVAAGDVHSVVAAERVRPATYVYSGGAGTTSIVQALAAGRLFASAGPRLDFWLEEEADGATVTRARAIAGQVAGAGRRWRPRFDVAGLDAPAGLRVLLRGLFPSAPPAGERAVVPTDLGPDGFVADLRWADPLPATGEHLLCVYAEARTADGTLQAVTAPIWMA